MCFLLVVPEVAAVLLLLLTVYHGHSAAMSMKEHLANCLEDKDHDVLLQTMKSGLPHINTSHHVVIVGAGMAGLTAAKLLHDAGHKVRASRAEAEG